MTVATLATTCARARWPRVFRRRRAVRSARAPPADRTSIASRRRARSPRASRAPLDRRRPRRRPAGARTDPSRTTIRSRTPRNTPPTRAGPPRCSSRRASSRDTRSLVNAFTAEEVRCGCRSSPPERHGGLPARATLWRCTSAAPSPRSRTVPTSWVDSERPSPSNNPATDEAAPRADDDVELVAPASSWSEEKAAAHTDRSWRPSGYRSTPRRVVDSASRRRPTAGTSPTSRCLNRRRGQRGTGKAMLAAAERRSRRRCVRRRCFSTWL